MNTAVQELYDRLMSVINHERQEDPEFRLSLAEVLGTLEVLKLNLWQDERSHHQES